MNKVTVIGDVNIDLLLSPIENYPKKDLQEKIPWLKIEVGGGAAHVSLTLSKLGIRTRLIGLVGKDIFGKFILEKMREFGVESRLRIARMETGISIGINFKDGSRSLLTYRGTNSLFSIKDFDLHEIKGEILFLSGYGLLENFRKDIVKVLKFAKNNGMITCMDPDVKSYKKFDNSEIKNVLKLVDFFFPDLEEGKVITGEKDKIKIVEKLLKLGCKTVALKLGKEGCIVGDKNNFLILGAIKTNVINSTGAGDFFNAGFVFGYMKHKELESAGTFGNAVAAYAISRFGDERYPCRAEVEKLVKGYEWKEK